MADYISKIKLPGSNTEYTIKDAEARSLIEALQKVGKFLGVSTTAITDGGTEEPTIGGSKVPTLTAGDMVIYEAAEFIWNGTAWAKFGDIDIDSLGEMAYADTASGNVTATGNVSVDLSVGAVSVTMDDYTPTGSLSELTFTGNPINATGSAEITGDVASSFEGSEMTSTGEFTPAGTIEAIVPAGNITVTPGEAEFVQTVAAPTVTTKTFTGNAVNATASTSANNFTASVDNEVLTFAAADGTVTVNEFTPTGSIDVAVAAPSVTKAAPTVSASFSGNSVTPKFTGSKGAVSVKGTPEGTVTSELSDATADVSVSATPTGTVTGSFVGTKAALTPKVSQAASSATASFVGNPVKVTVTPDD